MGEITEEVVVVCEAEVGKKVFGDTDNRVGVTAVEQSGSALQVSWLLEV